MFRYSIVIARFTIHNIRFRSNLRNVFVVTRFPLYKIPVMSSFDSTPLKLKSNSTYVQTLRTKPFQQMFFDRAIQPKTIVK